MSTKSVLVLKATVATLLMGATLGSAICFGQLIADSKVSRVLTLLSHNQISAGGNNEVAMLFNGEGNGGSKITIKMR